MRLSKKIPLYGIGINDSAYQVRLHSSISGKNVMLWICPFYKVWSKMIERCYSARNLIRNPTYTGCKVATEWHSFMAFREWMIEQPWQGNQLDKDILVRGNKTYSQSTCVFVSGCVNSFFADMSSVCGEWPAGVYFHKASGLFLSRCHNPFTGNRESLGYFRCPYSAHEAWRKRKHEIACQHAKTQVDKRVSDALLEMFAVDSV